MTSRFVSGGTITGDGAVAEAHINPDEERKDSGSGNNAVEWDAVQKDLEEERRKRDEARKNAVEGGAAGGERSLFEVLQANKAAKQAAFEEQNRIRNQFRALDDDEVDFLAGVSEEKRAEEDRVRRETEERLASFRKAQQLVIGGGDGDGDGDVGDAGDVLSGNVGVAADEWITAGARKRKREKEEKAGFKGLKKKMSLSEAGKDGVMVPQKGDDVLSAKAEVKPTPTPNKSGTSTSTTKASTTVAKPKPKPKLGLVDYGSDEDEDD